MIGPLVLRIECDDPQRARAIARALVEPLAQRGARVRVDGELVRTGPRFAAAIQTLARMSRGAACTIGLSDAEGARWLSPIELDEEPGAASDDIISYLERWGFLSGSASRAPA